MGKQRRERADPWTGSGRGQWRRRGGGAGAEPPLEMGDGTGRGSRRGEGEMKRGTSPDLTSRTDSPSSMPDLPHLHRIKAS